MAAVADSGLLPLQAGSILPSLSGAAEKADPGSTFQVRMERILNPWQVKTVILP